MSTAKIRAAFETRLATWAAAQVPPLPIAYENRTFNPPTDGSTYLRAFVLESPTLSSTLDRRHREYGGIFQVSIQCAPNTGVGAAQALAAQLCALWPPEQLFRYSDIEIVIEEPPSVGPKISQPEYFVVPVSVDYRCDTY